MSRTVNVQESYRSVCLYPYFFMLSFILFAFTTSVTLLHAFASQAEA